jgi:hypothetical protein
VGGATGNQPFDHEAKQFHRLRDERRGSERQRRDRRSDERASESANRTALLR